MENKLQIFDNPEFGKVRVVMIDGEPWFVAADVCRILDLGNPSQALTRLDDDEKGKIPENRVVVDPHLNIGSDFREVNVVNEPGLYRLVFASRKPEAHKFQHWVYHEVLPSIRKTGTYTVEGNNPVSEIEHAINMLVPLEWHGERVLPTPLLAKVYGVKRNTIIKVLSRCRERFTENVHFFNVKGDDLRTFLDTARDCDADVASHMAELHLWTCPGAALQAKLLTTKRSRKAFKLLETRYFGKTVTEKQRKSSMPQDKIATLLECAKLADNSELRDSIIRQTVKLILS